jgi:hypothetical protein
MYAMESYDIADRFHNVLQEQNSKFGKGAVVGVVWGDTPLPENMTSGLVICQLQYGMVARAFHVTHTPTGYILRFLGRRRKVVGDYFIPF